MTPLASIAALGLLSALAFWPGLFSPAMAPKWAVLAVGVPVALLMVPVPLRGVKVAAALLAAAAVTLLWSPDPIGGTEELLQGSILAGAFVLGASAMNLGLFWFGIELAVVIMSPLVVAQALGWELVQQAVPPAALFMNKNALAEVALVAAVTAAVYGTRKTLLPAMLVLALTVSKAALGALAMVGVAMLWRRRPKVAAVAALALAAVALAPFLLGHPNAAARWGIWSEALAAITLFGHGLGSFAAHFPEALYAHSEPVQALYELGVFALPVFALVWFALAGGPKDDSPEWFVLLALVGVGFFAFPFHMPVTGAAAALAAGALVGARVRARSGLDGLRAHGGAGA